MAFQWPNDSKEFNWPEDSKVPVAAHTRKPRSHVGAAIGGQLAGALATPLGPGSIPIAGAGGAAGEAFQQGMEAVPPTSGLNPIGQAIAGLMMGGSNPQEIALQGAQQAGLQSLGGVAATGAQKLAGPLMQLAVKATPEVAQTALREGIQITKAGRDKLLTKLGQYGARTKGIVMAAARNGRPFNVPDLIRDAYRDIYPKVATSMTGDEAAALRESVSKFVNQNPSATVNAYKLHKLKQSADMAADAIHSLPEGVRPTPGQQAVAGFYKAFADKARAALNNGVKGYAQSNEPTEALMQLKREIIPLTKKEMTAGARVLHATMRPGLGAAIGAGAGAAATPEHRTLGAMAGLAAGGLAASPPGASTLALNLTSPLVQMLLQRFPGLMGSAVLSQQ